MYEIRVFFDGKHWAVPLKDGARWRIGKSADCEVQVPDPRISDEHAELHLSADRLQIRRTRGERAIEFEGRSVETTELCSGSAFQIGGSSFMIVAVRDGMNLIDTQTVLDRAWDPTGSASGSSQRMRPVTGNLPIGAASASSQRYVNSQMASMRLLSQLFALITRSTDRQAFASAVLELLCRRLNATRALIAKVANAQRLEIIAARGFPPDADVAALISTTVLKQIVTERQAVVIGDTAQTGSGLTGQQSIVRNHIQAVACTPVFDLNRELIALLYVDNQDRPSEFSAHDAELLIWMGQFYSLLDSNLEMRRRLEAEVTELKQAASSGGQMIAEAPAMLLLLERVKRAAASEAAVLIQGESGTGKECIARLLYQQSARAGRPFVARNCAAIPESLFESEMFGHKKGAFTGAESDRKGAFVEANGGTLFLDEIGDLPLAQQTKLLRAIQEKLIRPVGSDKDVPVNVRVISATNRDLREACTRREFREDLYYRLATVTLNVPPLRDRRDDIVPLARHFVHSFSSGLRTLTTAAEERIAGYDWPGNVRELRSMMEQAVIFAAGNQIEADEINLPAKSSGSGILLGHQSLAEAERRHIMAVLQSVNDNKTEAAKLLGIARSTLLVKLNQYKQST